MLKKLLISLCFYIINLCTPIFSFICLILSWIDYKKIKESTTRKYKSITYTKLTETNEIHNICEKRSFIYIFVAISITLFINLGYSFLVFFIIHRFIEDHTGSWYDFFFNYKCKNLEEISQYLSGYADILFIFFIYSFLSSLIDNFTIMLLLSLIFLKFSQNIYKYLLEHFPGGIPLHWILLFVFSVAIIKLIVSYISYLIYFKFDEGIQINLPEETKDLIEKNFDYIIYHPYSTGIKAETGVIFNKTFIILKGNVLMLEDHELYAIILHEIGRGLNLGIHKVYFMRIFLLQFIISFFYFFFKLYVNEFYEGRNIYILFLLISLSFAIHMISDLILNIYNFRVELKADNYAIKEGYGEQLISALQKMNYYDLRTCRVNYLTNLLLFKHPCNYLRAINYDEQKFDNI